jgi:nucleoside-diphosphate-sugar epimerase
MQRILITGGAGFIGTHLAERLCDQADVVVFDNFRRDSLAHAPHLQAKRNMKIISGDVMDPASLKDAVATVDTVVHLAAVAGVSSYYNEPLKTLRTNILGTINLLEECRQQKVEHFVYFSTSEVYGSNALWVDESAINQVGPVADLRWVYATSKLAGETLSLRYSEQHGFACTVVRPFNIYGPRQLGEGAISNFCQAAVGNQPLTIYGDGSAIRAWCYISDLIDAVHTILEKRPACQLFNVGNPSEVQTTLGLAKRITTLLPGTAIRFQNTTHCEVKARIPVIDRARNLLAFQPKVDLDEGLSRTIEWFKHCGRLENECC